MEKILSEGSTSQEMLHPSYEPGVRSSSRLVR